MSTSAVVIPNADTNVELQKVEKSTEILLSSYDDAQKEQILAKSTELIKSVDVFNPATIRTFGNEAQKRLGQFSDGMLDRVKTKNTGEVGEGINALLVQLNDIDANDITKEDSGFRLSKLPVVGKYFNKMNNFFTKYETVKSNIDKISVHLTNQNQTLLRDNTTMENVYKQTWDYLIDVDAHIIAGSEVVRTLRKEDTTNLTPEQRKNRAIQIERLKKKVYNLYLLKAIAEQNIPQINTIVEHNEQLMDKIEQAVDTVIPVWKNQTTIALTLRNQKQASEISQKVTETTNELLKRNAANLKTNAIAIANENERGVVDVEALKQSYTDLVTTLKEVKKIKDAADGKRLDSLRKLQELESSMKKQILGLTESQENIQSITEGTRQSSF